MSKESYNWLINLNSLDFNKKSVIIVGSGWMADQYALALSKLKVQTVDIISNTEESSKKFFEKYKFNFKSGGYEKNLPLLEKVDLVIIATPIQKLTGAVNLAIDCGQTNILLEKPGALYHRELSLLLKKLTNQRVRIAFNRILYSNFYKLKHLVEQDGGITSCIIDFTEWIHRINFEKLTAEICNRWGICNSLHVISMAMEIIGMPKQLSSCCFGKLDWHPTGSIFVGSGITEKNIPFTYHADWGSAGRWGIEIITKKNAYRLIPLESLSVCTKGDNTWNQIHFESVFPDVKPGVAEEIAVMLADQKEDQIPLISLSRAIEYHKLAEKIFGYKKT